MIIDNKELVELLEKEQGLQDGLKDAKDEIAELTGRVKEIQEEKKAELKEIETLRQEISKIFVPLALAEKGEFETFKHPVVKNGKVEVEFEDHKPQTLEDAENELKEKIKDIDAGWRKHLGL